MYTICHWKLAFLIILYTFFLQRFPKSLFCGITRVSCISVSGYFERCKKQDVIDLEIILALICILTLHIVFFFYIFLMYTATWRLIIILFSNHMSVRYMQRITFRDVTSTLYFPPVNQKTKILLDCHVIWYWLFFSSHLYSHNTKLPQVVSRCDQFLNPPWMTTVDLVEKQQYLV